MIEYWLKGSGEQENFGDTAAILLKNLFARDIEADPDLYFLVGSYLNNHWAEKALAKKPEGAKVHFWGCGWRDEKFDYATHPDIQIHGVRGPLTRDALGLSADTPLGDPALLLPLVLPKPAYNTGKVLLVPHFYETHLPEIMNDRADIGYDDMILPHLFRAGQLEMLIREIASATFVMAGALHAAIIAHAYNVPFCFFRKEHLDLPAKWNDTAMSFGIDAHHVYKLRDGLRFWETYRHRLVKPDLAKLLQAAPAPVKPEHLAAVSSL